MTVILSLPVLHSRLLCCDTGDKSWHGVSALSAAGVHRADPQLSPPVFPPATDFQVVGSRGVSPQGTWRLPTFDGADDPMRSQRPRLSPLSRDTKTSRGNPGLDRGTFDIAVRTPDTDGFRRTRPPCLFDQVVEKRLWVVRSVTPANVTCVPSDSAMVVLPPETVAAASTLAASPVP
jgi:hypothetical protein